MRRSRSGIKTERRSGERDPSIGIRMYHTHIYIPVSGHPLLCLLPASIDFRNPWDARPCVTKTTWSFSPWKKNLFDYLLEKQARHQRLFKIIAPLKIVCYNIIIISKLILFRNTYPILIKKYQGWNVYLHFFSAFTWCKTHMLLFWNLQCCAGCDSYNCNSTVAPSYSNILFFNSRNYLCYLKRYRTFMHTM